MRSDRPASRLNLTDKVYKMLLKAEANDFAGRFREIISDPLNLLINRHALAGVVENNFIILHNGHRVPLSGPYAYYGEFSEILIINRGVHEPLEEYVFQELLKVLPEAPSMLELGAYWGHYSMWLKKMRPASAVYLVEPDKENIQAGIHNFKQNGYTGTFIEASVGKNQFEVDTFLQDGHASGIDILHADIQGYEVEMIEGCRGSLQQKLIDYVLISTHSQKLHAEIIRKLDSFGYRVEVSADFDHQTTSYDGFVFASSPLKEAVFCNFSPLGRTQIAASSSIDLLTMLSQTLATKKSGGAGKLP